MDDAQSHVQNMRDIVLDTAKIAVSRLCDKLS